MRVLALPRRLLLRAFKTAMPALDWSFLLVGLAGAVGTAVGLLPPFTDSLWAKITTVLLWLLFAREGYDSMVEEGGT